MFKHTAVQVHKKIVKKDDHTISIVPRPSGPDFHPVIEGVELRASFMMEEDQKDQRVIARGMLVLYKMTLTEDTEEIITYYRKIIFEEEQSGATLLQLSTQG